MALKKDSQSRRSDRLMFMIPLRAEGLTETGEAFQCGGHAVEVNRFGAHIRLDHPVSVARKILLTNLENNLRGEFRVVRVLETTSTGETDFGVEALGNYPYFWGIDFPARPRKPGESRGLLECQQCGNASLQPLSIDEIEVLESGDNVQRLCQACGSKTAWKFAMQSSRTSKTDKGSMPFADGNAAGQQGRVAHTIFMQRPVSIQTASGEIEDVQTENLSKDEIRYTSEKNYEVNQVVTVEWENSGTGQRLQVPGRIRRRLLMPGSRRVFYSIRYVGSPVILPPLPLKSAKGLYVAMGLLMGGASVFLEIIIQAIASNPVVSIGSTARRVACLGGVLLLASLAHKVWKAILVREPEGRRPFRKRHRVATSACAVVFLGALGFGAIDGVAHGYQSARVRIFLRDYALAQIYESNLNAAEDRVMAGPADYIDACTTLELLAEKWREQLDALNVDEVEVYHAWILPNKKLRDKMKDLRDITTLDHRKLQVVQQQIALKAQAGMSSPDKQQAFWQNSFPPLRQKIREIDAQKTRIVKILMEQK